MIAKDLKSAQQNRVYGNCFDQMKWPVVLLLTILRLRVISFFLPFIVAMLVESFVCIKCIGS